MSDSRSQQRRLPTRLSPALALALSALVGTFSRADDVDFQVERLNAGIKATLGGKPVLEYRSAKDAFKPYLAKLYTPAGVQLLQDSPPDHVHHHGLMFALGVNDVNFWQESPGVEGPPFIGRQRGGDLEWHVDSRDEGPRKLVVTQAVDWLGRENRSVVRERRELSSWRAKSSNCLFLTWTSELSVAGGQESIVLTGERYYGLGMRFARTMDGGGKFLFAEDRSADPKEGSENLVRASWCAYTAKTGGVDVTVAVFGSATNRRHPTLWFTMVEPFAYLTATLDLHNRQLKIPSGDAIELTYGIAAADGTLGPEEIEQLYQAWLRQRDGSLERTGRQKSAAKEAARPADLEN